MKQDSLFNGAAASGGWEHTRAFHYGDGVFRSILVHRRECVDWERHLLKLRQDAAALDMDLPDKSLLKAEATLLIGNCEAGVLKLILSRRAGPRGYAPGSRDTDRLLQLHPLPDYPATFWNAGISAGWSAVRLSAQPLLAGIKHLNRLEQMLASRESGGELAEMLMCDADDHVVTGIRSNLFLVSGGMLLTPDLSLCGVAGMMRGRLLELAGEESIACKIETIARERVGTADEVFLCNALIGIWPARRVGTREFEAPGSITTLLSRKLAHPRWFES